MMPNEASTFERGVVVISLDAEQIWGYLDLFDEQEFYRRYANAPAAYESLLRRLCEGHISATWALVGGLTLGGMAGPEDPRLQGFPKEWVGAIRAGTEATAPLWYQRSFVQRLKAANPPQDVGLHGGLTHLVWTSAYATPAAVQREFVGGIAALSELTIQPRSFIFARNEIAYLELLVQEGICCYRGRAPSLSEHLRMQLPRAILRVLEELGQTVPPVVWPSASLPGLWNIPSSLALYPISRARTKLVPLRTRIERACKGLEAAARCRGIFHYWLHPDTLAESPNGFWMLDAILEQVVRARDAGDVEVLTMAEVARRMQVGCDSEEASLDAAPAGPSIESLTGRCH